MPMIPPLVRDPPPGDAESSTSRPVAARMVRTQRRYASNFNISFVYEPPKPITTFDKWRAAAAELDPHVGAAAHPSNPEAGAPPGVAAAPRRRLHDVLLGTTAVVLLGVLGSIGYAVWSGSVPGIPGPDGTASTGSRIAAVVPPLADLAAKAAGQAVPDRALATPSGKEAAGVPPPQPAPLPSTGPDRLALATPLVDKPAVADRLLPASGPLPVAEGAVPGPKPAALGPVPSAKLSESDEAPPASTLPAATADARPAPEPGATLPAPAMPSTTAPVAKAAAAPAVAASIPPPKPDAALPAPAMASTTVRLLPAPDWTGAGVSKLDSLPEAAALLAAPPAPLAVPAPSAGPAAPTAEMAKAAPAGVDAQQVVSTMELVQQMSLLVHDMHGEGVRYRMEVTALTGAVQAKAASLEERLKLAEARSVAGADAGGSQAVGVSPVLRGYRVQAGSPGAAVLSDAGAGPERAARLLVMVGDQLPGAGRVTGIVQRGGAWTVRTERGVIQ